MHRVSPQPSSLSVQVQSVFQERTGQRPQFLVRSPGRVNLIGEHTDYNDGFVLPMAINRNVWLAATPRTDARVRVFSLDMQSECEIDLSDLSENVDGWGNYVQAVAWVLQEEGHALKGWDGVVASDVPIGSGLSSSAALELAVARCFAQTSGLSWDPVQMAKRCQRAENEWVGMNCGIMDQLIVAAGRQDHALLIDCRSLNLEAVPLPANAAIVVMDTDTRRGLVESAYNERRSQCEKASEFFGVSHLRDVSIATLESRSGDMEAGLQKRSRHVITENNRTVEASRRMKVNDLVGLGQLMNESHDSLRDDYEVTNEALNIMVSLARAQHGCHGARMTGAGFGGCAIALVDQQMAESFTTNIHQLYQSQTGRTPVLYVCHAAEGVSLDIDR